MKTGAQNMTAKHTAGPWRYDETWALIYGPRNEEIAAVHAARGDSRRVDPDLGKRNALLLAAAPDLLAALESCLTFWDAPPSSFDGCGDTRRATLVEIKAAARAAIAKAKGGAA